MTISVAAGRLKHLLTIQAPETVRDSVGGITTTWCDKKQVMAEIMPKSAREMVSGDQLTQDLTLIIRFRYLPGFNVTPSMRLVKKGCPNRYYNIQQALNSQMRNILTEVTAIEDLNVSS
jgi:SPP1 family predicted phage head-tail adaptor